MKALKAKDQAHLMIGAKHLYQQGIRWPPGAPLLMLEPAEDLSGFTFPGDCFAEGYSSLWRSAPFSEGELW